MRPFSSLPFRILGVPTELWVLAPPRVKVTVRGPGTPAAPESRSLPKHKKNPDVGTKETIFADVIYVDQKDAQNFAQDEEVRFPSSFFPASAPRSSNLDHRRSP